MSSAVERMKFMACPDRTSFSQIMKEHQVHEAAKNMSSVFVHVRNGDRVSKWLCVPKAEGRKVRLGGGVSLDLSTRGEKFVSETRSGGNMVSLFFVNSSFITLIPRSTVGFLHKIRKTEPHEVVGFLTRIQTSTHLWVAIDLPADESGSKCLCFYDGLSRPRWFGADPSWIIKNTSKKKVDGKSTESLYFMFKTEGCIPEWIPGAMLSDKTEDAFREVRRGRWPLPSFSSQESLGEWISQ